MSSKNCRNLYLSILLALTPVAIVTAPATSDANAVTASNSIRAENQERREFLYNLGFDDISSRIRERLARHEYVQELNRRQMEANVVSYEVLNAARELSILMLEKYPLKDLSGNAAQEIALFAAKMLNLKPYAPATDYPSEIISIADERKRHIALERWLDERRLQQMNEHKVKILSDITHLLFGQEVAANKASILEIDGLLNTIVDRMYLDNEIGNSKFFGRALTALLVREEKLHGDGQTPITETMAAELKDRYNLYLENYIGDTMVMPTLQGEQRYTIENGTMMLSRNLSPGSLQISWAAIPNSQKRQWEARAKGLLGNPFAAGIYVTPEDTMNGITTGMRIRNYISQEGLIREGFSHIVYYQLKEDPKTGIKMPRVVHNYPDRTFDRTDDYVRTGGVMIVYPEQVIDLSHHSAVYFASPDPVKTKAWFDESWKKGYRKGFFPSSPLKFDETGMKPVKTEANVTWKTKISEAEFNAIHAETDPVKASRVIWGRFASGLENGVERGIGFHWPDPYDFNIIEMTYCSLFGVTNMFEQVGVDLEQVPSEWHPLLKALSGVGTAGEKLTAVPGLKKLGSKIETNELIKKAQKITKIAIVAPTSLVLQSYMMGKKFLFPPKTPEQRAQSSYMVDPYHEADARLTVSIQRQIESLGQFRSTPAELFLAYGAAIRDLEYGMVMRASRGVKTKGVVNIENMADTASELAAPRAFRQMRKAEAAKAACDAQMAKLAQNAEG